MCAGSLRVLPEWYGFAPMRDAPRERLMEIHGGGDELRHREPRDLGPVQAKTMLPSRSRCHSAARDVVHPSAIPFSRPNVFRTAIVSFV